MEWDGVVAVFIENVHQLVEFVKVHPDLVEQRVLLK